MLKKKSGKSVISGKASAHAKGGSGVSLDDDDAIDVGLFSSGPATVRESIFVGDYDYGGHAKPSAVWLLTFSRDGEEDYEQPYSLGKGWGVSKDGKSLVAKQGQTGLPKSCNAMRHLVKPLKKALKDSDVEVDLTSGDPSVLDGLDVVLRRVAQEVREGLPQKKGETKERSILEIEEVTGQSEPGAKKKAKKKAKPADDDEEDAEPEDDQDEDEEAEDEEADSDSDDEDEDEGSARGKKKPAAKAKAKAKKSLDDDDEEDESDDDDDADADSDDDDYDAAEDGAEAIIDLVADGPIKLAELEKKLTRSLKGNKHAEAIIEWATNVKNLKRQKGWTFDGKLLDAE